MAMTFGLDLSHHQGAFDFVRAAQEDIAFVILKATEGDGFIDSRFAVNFAAARQAGLLVAAYHYQRNDVSAAAQIANVQRVVPRDVPVILDVEANSGSVALTRDLVAQLRAVGYRVPLTYLPRWYWQQIGSPSLAGLPPLWSSRYPDNVVGTIADEFADVPAHYWDGYGGLPVALLQFTSSAAVAGRAPIDANAYRGTRAEFAALLGEEEDDMAGEGPNILAAVMTGGPSTRAIKPGEPLPTGVDPTSILGRTADVQFALTKALPILMAAAAQSGDALDVDTARALISAAVHDAVDAAMPEALPADVDPADVAAIAEAVKQKLAEALAGGTPQ